MYCEKCGTENTGSNFNCIRCGERLYYHGSEADSFERSLNGRFWSVKLLFVFASVGIFLLIAFSARDAIPHKYDAFFKPLLAAWLWASWVAGHVVAEKFVRT